MITKIRRIVLIGLFSYFLSATGFAQLQDNNWVNGGFSDDLAIFGSSGDVINDSFPPIMNAYTCLESGNNTLGKLLFYTNGITIRNAEKQIMKNGDSLNFPNPYFDIQHENGLAGMQSAIILPKPNNNKEYYIFHNAPDTVFSGNGGYMPMRLLFSVVDMELDSGRGAVVVGKKNIPIIENTQLSWSRMTACKHANGRDWWIIKPAAYVNTFYKFLLTPEGILGPLIQQIGPNYGIRGKNNEQGGWALFTNNGEHFANGTFNSLIVLMDFDRCTGVFSNPKTLNHSRTGIVDDIGTIATIPGINSLAFSSSGRYLYSNDRLTINQFDLEASNPQDSVQLAVFSDSCFVCDYMGVNAMQLAPNGKIYISTYSGGAGAWHVINKPDEKGMACNFVRFGQQVFAINSTTIPSNFYDKLVSDSTSDCDTIKYTSLTPLTPEGRIKVYPNPTNNWAQIETTIEGESKMSIVDVTGKLLLSETFTTTTKVNIASYASGLYLLKIQDRQGNRYSCKLVKE